MSGELVLRGLQHIWETLRALNVPAAVIGGIALAAWKHVRATKDIDLLVAIDPNDAKHFESVLQGLSAAGMRTKRTPPVTNLGRLKIIQLLYEPPDAMMDLQVDLLVADLPYHRAALDRRVFTQLPDLGLEVAVLACEDLILHKLLAGRMIDLADSVALLRANRKVLDLDYLNRWAGRLEVVADLAGVWKEAFPEPSG